MRAKYLAALLQARGITRAWMPSLLFLRSCRTQPLSSAPFMFLFCSVPSLAPCAPRLPIRTVVCFPWRTPTAWPALPRQHLSQPSAVLLSLVPREVSRFLRASLTHACASSMVSRRAGMEGDSACRAHLTSPLLRPPAHPLPACPRSLAQALERGPAFSYMCLRALGTGWWGCKEHEGPFPLLLSPSLKQGLFTW